jgi:hypothetical protein
MGKVLKVDEFCRSLVPRAETRRPHHRFAAGSIRSGAWREGKERGTVCCSFERGSPSKRLKLNHRSSYGLSFLESQNSLIHKRQNHACIPNSETTTVSTRVSQPSRFSSSREIFLINCYTCEQVNESFVRFTKVGVKIKVLQPCNIAGAKTSNGTSSRRNTITTDRSS